ncbi:anterior gradient protein 3-like [Megalops cyprinoides]|uniref:anterior gradient protein 3-like n=1 Tax=Megalops cyprinoides TaxID=118141 RepID=UPI00186556E7|nr:anterior gradient protein 3-like [Megalops cyprinoides]
MAREWGEDIDWVQTYQDALNMARSRQKPLMVIHHLDECPLSQGLKAAFSAHEEIQRMAKEDFIMFNVVHETGDRNLAPDGYYVPRIIFIDPSLLIRMDITGKSETHKYTYTHTDVELLMENMKKARIPHNSMP